MLNSRVLASVYVLLLVLSVHVHGIAWSSKFDDLTPETQSGEDEQEEAEMPASSNTDKAADTTDSTSAKIYDGSFMTNSEPMTLADLQGRLKVDVQIN
jgi:hypothetical protein